MGSVANVGVLLVDAVRACPSRTSRLRGVRTRAGCGKAGRSDLAEIGRRGAQGARSARAATGAGHVRNRNEAEGFEESLDTRRHEGPPAVGRG